MFLINEFTTTTYPSVPLVLKIYTRIKVLLGHLKTQPQEVLLHLSEEGYSWVKYIFNIKRKKVSEKCLKFFFHNSCAQSSCNMPNSDPMAKHKLSRTHRRVSLHMILCTHLNRDSLGLINDSKLTLAFYPIPFEKCT